MPKSNHATSGADAPPRRETLRRELVQRLGGLLPEQEALVYELVCILGLAPLARRVLHRLSGDGLGGEDRLGLLSELVALRDAVPPIISDGGVTAQVEELMDQDTGNRSLLQLNESWAELGPVLRGHVVAFVRGLADAEPLVAAAAARAAIQQAIQEDGLGKTATGEVGLEC